MEFSYNFNQITETNRRYNVQGKIDREPNYYQTNSQFTNSQFTILSFIIRDIEQNTIECLAFNESAKHFGKHKLSIDDIYVIKNVKAVKNNRYPKTSHNMKLLLDEKSIIKKTKIQECIKNGKIFVISNKKKQKFNQQLSIKNWFNVN